MHIGWCLILISVFLVFRIARANGKVCRRVRGSRWDQWMLKGGAEGAYSRTRPLIVAYATDPKSDIVCTGRECIVNTTIRRAWT